MTNSCLVEGQGIGGGRRYCLLDCEIVVSFVDATSSRVRIPFCFELCSFSLHDSFYPLSKRNSLDLNLRPPRPNGNPYLGRENEKKPYQANDSCPPFDRPAGAAVSILVPIQVVGFPHRRAPKSNPPHRDKRCQYPCCASLEIEAL